MNESYEWVHALSFKHLFLLIQFVYSFPNASKYMDGAYPWFLYQTETCIGHNIVTLYRTYLHTLATQVICKC